MDKLIIGRYIVGDSFIHRLDPRSKLLAMLIYIIVISCNLCCDNSIYTFLGFLV